MTPADLSLDLWSPESLTSRDQLICSSLEEKLQVYASLSALSGRTDGLPAGPRLLVQPQWEEPPLQAAALLAAAVKEGERRLWACTAVLSVAGGDQPECIEGGT